MHRATTGRPTRPATRATVILLLAATTAACGDDDPAAEPTPTVPGQTQAPAEPAPTPEPTGDSATADEAELEALFLSYWDVVADLWNDPRIDVEAMSGIGTDGRIETMMSYIDTELISNNARRAGGPEFGDVTVAIDGDEAVVEACMDRSEWKLMVDGSEVAIDLSEAKPSVVLAVKVDGQWLVDDAAGEGEASITC